MSATDFQALVLAGGRGSRLGGADKANLELHGRRLVDRAVDAARRAGAGRVVVIGPDSAGTRADAVLREDPPFAGPLAALAAGLPSLSAPWVLVLACDLQRPTAVATELAAALAEGLESAEDGVVLRDADGRVQWLAGIYRTQALHAVCAALGDRVVNAPVRRALGELTLRELPVDNDTSSDIDTPQALERARAKEKNSMGQYLPPEALETWLVAAAKELELDDSSVDIATILDVAKHVAHEVARPAAPLSTFLLGLAVGRGKGELAGLSEQLIERAHRWADEHPEE
ncbi:NTP transferase domain-containing protein [Glutamicibacter sp. NPDC087344]|uniref:NTP transferase domain-containing protein n=1 Tax=Glutamicibacter sp. NPDC087344 TaxID=3363994 RepID=UPI00381D98DE